MKKYLALFFATCFYTFSFATVECHKLSLNSATNNTLAIFLPTSPSCDNETFEIKYRIHGSGDPFNSINFSLFYLNGPQALIRNLEACTEYDIYVAVYCDDNLEGICVTWQAFVTTGCPGLDCSGIAPVNITATTAQITMDGFTDCRTGSSSLLLFDLAYKKSGNPVWYNPPNSISTSSRFANIKDLEECTSYDYRIRFWCDDAYTDWCTGRFTTYCTGCDEVIPYEVDETSVQFSYDGFEDCLDANGELQYEVVYKTAPSSTWNTTSSSTDLTFIQLDDLSPCTVYEYRIRFLCDGTYTPFCTGTFVTTGCIGCEGIDIINISERHAQITLFGYEDCRMPDDFLHYEVDLKSTLATTWISFGVATRGNIGNFNGLSPCTAYEYRIRFLCDGEYTDWCVGTFMTPCMEELPTDSEARAALAADEVTAATPTFQVFPNPVSAGGFVNIRSAKAKSLHSVQFRSVNGQLLFQQEVLLQKGLQVPAQLNPGIYILTISGKEGSERVALLVY